jgi:hypothetical protein
MAAGSAEAARKQVRAKELVRLRRGAYLRGALGADGAETHRTLVAATVPLMSAPPILSYESAAAFHGIPLLGQFPDRVHVTVPAARGGRSSGAIVRHAHVEPPPTVTLFGQTVTTAARTVVDLARTRGMRQGVVAADHVLRHGLATREDLTDAVTQLGRARGTRVAHAVVEFADARSESPGESLSRVIIRELGYADPTLQVEVITADGRVYRCDFGWEGGLVGEFDGRAKYHLTDGRGTPEERLWEEKRREDAIRATGRRMVRWVYADLTHERLGPILQRAGLLRRPQ